MAHLTVEGYETRIPLNPAISILNHLLMNGVPIPHVCGGKMQCGTCVIEILEGSRFLNPVKDSERARLAAVGAEPGMRLACQTHSVGDLSIRIPPGKTRPEA